MFPFPPKPLPPKNEKPFTAEKLPAYLAYFGVTVSAKKVVTAKKRETVYRRKTTGISHYRSICVRQIKRYRGVPSENRGSTVSHIPGCSTINIATLGCHEDRWSQNHAYKRHTQPTGLSVAACCVDFARMYICMYVCMVITYSRVWINRVRLPILLVVS